MTSISFVDLGIFVVIVFFIIRGYQQGMIRQTVGIFAFALALVLAVQYYETGAEMLVEQELVSRELANLISFSLIALLVTVGVNLIGQLVQLMSRMFFLSLLDNIAGALVGLLKGGILVFLLLMVCAEIPSAVLAEELNRSAFAGDFLAFAPLIRENLFSIFKP